MRNRSTPPPNSMMYSRYNESAPFFPSLKWGEGWSKFFIHFVQDCRFDRFVFGSTCRSIRPGLSNRTAKDRLRFKRRTLRCAESNAYITTTKKYINFYPEFYTFPIFVMHTGTACFDLLEQNGGTSWKISVPLASIARNILA